MGILKEYSEVPEKHWLFPKSFQSRKEIPNPDLEKKRQWLIFELLQTYNYPRQFFEKRILYFNSQLDRPTIGFSVLTEFGDPFLTGIITQNPDEGVEELKGISRTSPSLRSFILSDGTRNGTKFLKKRADSEEFEIANDIERYVSPSRIGAPIPYGNCLEYKKTKNCKYHGLEKLSNTVEDILFEAHSHIRDIDGYHADEALDELCKVLYAKMYDEENTASENAYVMQRLRYGCIEECAAAVRRLYQDANEYDLRVFALKVPGYKRSRGVFNKEIRLSSNALVKVVECFQGYSLMKSEADIKGRAFQKILGSATRAGMGQYFTPGQVVKLIVNALAPTEKDLILDPFAGSGHFLTQSLEYVKRSRVEFDEMRFNEFAFHKLHGIEKSERMVRVAMTDMRLHGDGHSNIRCTDALLEMQNYADLESNSFDIIMTNPPFGSLLSFETVKGLATFQLAEGRKSVPLEIIGIERCIEFLRPGGRLAIVLPEGIFANSNTKYVRKWLIDKIKIVAIVSLPIETFTPFGANIKTSVLIGRKRKAGENKQKDYEIMMCKVESVGYDASGRESKESDAEQVGVKIAEFMKRNERHV